MIRVSTRAEIRHMHLVEGVPKKEIARRLGVNIKTVRRHVQGSDSYPSRCSPKRGRAMDPYRVEIVELLTAEPKISSKRVGRLLEKHHGIRFSARTVRRHVQELRGSLRKPEVFVHRTHLPGETMEIDFGEAWAEIAGRRTKILFFVGTLPASNTYFAKAYLFQRIECLLDGITSAVEWFGGLPMRMVFDNASTAVKKILKGEERVETEAFHAYRSEWPLGADFCNPASGWEKGSVERGVEYVRGAALRPMPVVESIEALNGIILHELEIDLDRRKLRDGRSARAALDDERLMLRPIPENKPSTARVTSCTADKYAHVRIDRSTYSVPSQFARATLTAHLYHDRVEIANGHEVIAIHRRSTVAAAYVLELDHVLGLLERKPRAAQEATVIRQMGLPQCFDDFREALRRERGNPNREWVQVVGLLIDHSLASVCTAVEASMASGAPGLGSVRQLLRQEDQPRVAIDPIGLSGLGLADVEISAANLAEYESLLGGLVA